MTAAFEVEFMTDRSDHEVHSAIAALRSVLQTLAARDESPFLVPALISHAVEAASQGPERLRNYAVGAVNARIFLLSLSIAYRTRYFVELYLTSYESKNPFGMLFAARAQVELYAVAADVARVIEENATGDEAHMAERVSTVDRALITATLGTRSEAVKNAVRADGGSAVRSPSEEDIQAIDAVNVVSRIKRADQQSEYEGLTGDYERLCEYLHPNVGQTILLMVEASANTAKFSTLAEEPMMRALDVSLNPMRRAAELSTRLAFSPVFPFGPPQIDYSQGRA